MNNENNLNLNYIGAFLTFRCPYKCTFCINNYREVPRLQYSEITGRNWVNFFLNLDTPNIPITIQGGEPGVHKDFVEIVKSVSPYKKIEILTTLKFDLDNFVSNIDPGWLNREGPYAPIRISYHPEQFSLMELIEKCHFLSSKGFDLGVYSVLHPDQEKAINDSKEIFLKYKIDFRTKPFLGIYKNKLHGDYFDNEALLSKSNKTCECRTSELLIAPDGGIYKCHHDLYEKKETISNIDVYDIKKQGMFHECSFYGKCHPCDIKVKNNRFQEFGHSSVQIKNLK